MKSQLHNLKIYLKNKAPQREITKWDDLELDKIYAVDKIRKLGTKIDMAFDSFYADIAFCLM